MEGFGWQYPPPPQYSTTPNSVVVTNSSNEITTINLGALQSVRKNATNDGLEPYNTSSGGGINSAIYSGQWKINSFYGTKGSSTGWNGFAYYVPFLITSDITITDMGIEVITGTAGSNIRLAVYLDNNGKVGNVLDQSGDISSATNGFKSYQFTSELSFTTSQKIFWLSLQSSASATSLRMWNTPFNILGNTNTTGATTDTWRLANAYGAFPPNASLATTSASNPLMFFVKVK